MTEETNKEPEAKASGFDPPCPTCGRWRDDVDTMTDDQLVLAIRKATLQHLLRSMRGTPTGQELAVARGLLRDNRAFSEVTPEKDNPDPALPAQAPKMPLLPETDYSNTDGG